MVTIPKTQRSPVQCYIQRVRSGVQRLWPYYALWLCPDDTMPVSRVCGVGVGVGVCACVCGERESEGERESKEAVCSVWTLGRQRVVAGSCVRKLRSTLHIYVYMYIYVYTYVYTYIYVYVYMYIYII